MEAEVSRFLHLNLGDKTEVERHFIPISRDEELAKQARRRYGSDATLSGDAIDRVHQIYDYAKTILIADRAHITVVWILRGTQVVEVITPMFYDQASKRMAIFAIADRVESLGADGVNLVSEAWMASLDPGEDPRDPRTPPARARANRREALQVVGATRDGRTATKTSIFSRGKDGSILFDEEWSEDKDQLNLLNPIVRRWADMAKRGR
jgi:hypothetical protein